jgi:hypothetical protein
MMNIIVVVVLLPIPTKYHLPDLSIKKSHLLRWDFLLLQVLRVRGGALGGWL